MENTPQSRHSERRRAPLFWALGELHQLAEKRLKIERGVGDRRRQILRGLLRATTALNHASAGRDVELNLTRMRAALDDCEVGLLLLYDVLGAAFIDLALAHIDRIVRGIDHLASLQPAVWPDAELPPLPNIDKPAVDGQPTSILRILTERIAALVPVRVPATLRTRTKPRRRYRNGSGTS